MTDDDKPLGKSIEEFIFRKGGTVTHDDKTLGTSIEEFMQGLDDYVELDPECTNDAGHLVINWGRKGVGFGQLSFQTRDGVLVCDNETMGRKFCQGVLIAFATSMPAEDWPPMIKRFRGIASLLDACTPTSGEW